MSQAAPPPDGDDTQRPRVGANPRRGRAVVIGTIVGVIVAIFAVLLLVTQCGSSADDVSQAPVGTSADVAGPVPAG
ncbi:hypothetical protein ACI78T_03930 [Blastococcus sp. SYSU D00922]